MRAFLTPFVPSQWRRICWALLASAIGASILLSQASGNHALTEVYHNDDFQITGVAVSKTGRIFVNFPRWSDHYLNAVLEVMKDGTVKPYPDESWNRWNKKLATAGKQFVCVQSVVADDKDSLWVVDAAAPLLTSVVPGGPKVVRIDLRSNSVAKVYPIGPDIAKTDSYLNDIRVDTAKNVAYLTDSGGTGGLIVLDLNSGKAHRALDGHPSVKAESGISISVNGKPVIGVDGKPPQFNSDGIALSPDGSYLYYQALTGKTIYRIATSVLRDESQTANAGTAVEKVATTFPADGIWMDPQGRLYLSNINQSGVFRRDKNGTVEKLLTDPRLEWPDTFSQGPDGSIYITASHINDGPEYNHGKSPRTKPYTLFKFNP